ncbi:MAG TPA: lysozyme [Polyangiaceae bacterium]
MRLSDNGRTLIKGFEGLSLKAYPDTSKGYSIGYGHFGAKPGDVITRQEADRLFDQDVAKYELAVSMATPNAAQHEFDAMTSLAYNIGTAGFRNSTVAARHNMGDRQGAADAFRMWKKADGKDHPGLIARREKERGVYLNGYAGAPPAPSFPSPAPQQSTPGWPEVASSAPVPGQESGWSQATSSAPVPGVSPEAMRAAVPASIASLLAIALGWFVYQLAR